MSFFLGDFFSFLFSLSFLFSFLFYLKNLQIKHQANMKPENNIMTATDFDKWKAKKIKRGKWRHYPNCGYKKYYTKEKREESKRLEKEATKLLNWHKANRHEAQEKDK